MLMTIIAGKRGQQVVFGCKTGGRGVAGVARQLFRVEATTTISYLQLKQI